MLFEKGNKLIKSNCIFDYDEDHFWDLKKFECALSQFKDKDLHVLRSDAEVRHHQTILNHFPFPF